MTGVALYLDELDPPIDRGVLVRFSRSASLPSLTKKPATEMEKKLSQAIADLMIQLDTDMEFTLHVTMGPREKS